MTIGVDKFRDWCESKRGRYQLIEHFDPDRTRHRCNFPAPRQNGTYVSVMEDGWWFAKTPQGHVGGDDARIVDGELVTEESLEVKENMKGQPMLLKEDRPLK